ncbi:hypothetical protein G4X40_20105 [Rhodococcus sp. D2-41]|uniref:hypothetical protein n=1 Tax=Speluncibacter jeojiensis TaxID=2710754 RepID=UPI00240FA977|nr:hypothetical protein [Rhodococcus sp. D2-41]MDG3012447.1 hypothetical protein [Rhodococcus sp. D2-41]
MTTPGGAAPDGAWQYGSRYGQDITEASAKAMIRGQGAPGYESADDHWKGEIDKFAADLDAVRDGQIGLGDRVDLLEGAQGYCCLFMSRNWNVPGGRWIVLPFDTQLGPNVGASPYSGAGIVFGSQGLWRADAHVTFYPPPASWFGSTTYVLAQLSIVVMNGGYEFSRKTFDIVITSAGAETAAFSHTFVLPGPNYSVHLELKHQQSGAWIYGGTTRSALSVNKWSVGVDNALVLPTVPDGGTLT